MSGFCLQLVISFVLEHVEFGLMKSTAQQKLEMILVKMDHQVILAHSVFVLEQSDLQYLSDLLLWMCKLCSTTTNKAI